MTPSAAVVAMQKVARALHELARVPAKVAAQASENLREVLEEQHGAEVDPYDRPWEPLAPQTVKRKGGDARILRRSNRMLDDLKIAPLARAGVSIAFGRAESAFHQIGTRNMPARRLLPVAGLPSKWADALREAAASKFDDWAQGAAS